MASNILDYDVSNGRVVGENEGKRALKQMATCIHVLGSVYVLQSEYDLACIYNMGPVTCIHCVCIIFWYSYYVQLRIVLLVELNLLYLLMSGHALLYRVLVIQCKFTRQVMASKSVFHMLSTFHSGDDSCYGALDCHTLWWICTNSTENTLSC